jgi:hypothetical protein
MPTIEQSDFLLEQVRKKVQQKRRRVIAQNLLLFFLLLLMFIGISGSVYYYSELKEANTKLSKNEIVLKSQQNKLDSLNEILRQRNIVLKKDKEFLESTIDSASHAKNPKLILQPIVAARDSARKYAETGYKMLKMRDFNGAFIAFNKSENFYNGYRESYEVAFLLRKNRQRWNDPQRQNELLDTIYRKLNSKKILRKEDIQ